jgi:hypothetical protein
MTAADSQRTARLNSWRDFLAGTMGDRVTVRRDSLELLVDDADVSSPPMVGSDTLAAVLARTLGQFHCNPEWAGERIVGDLDNPTQFAAAQGKWEEQEYERSAQIEAMEWVLDQPEVTAILAALAGADDPLRQAVEALADEWEKEPYPQTASAGWNNGADMRRESDAAELRRVLNGDEAT